MSKTVAFYGIIFLLALFELKLVVLSQNVSGETTADLKAPTKPTNEDGDVSSYFHQDPFGPNTYAFGYEIDDQLTGNVQFRDERRYLNGTVEGSYGYVRPDGLITVTHYHSDEFTGFLSYTDNFAAGEQPKWEHKWPSSNNGTIFERNQNNAPMIANYDKEHHLNLTNENLPNDIANQLKKQHNLNVNVGSQNLTDVNATVMDLLSGKVPLLSGKVLRDDENKNTVQNITNIPANFPITPFQLPERYADKPKYNNKTVSSTIKTVEENTTNNNNVTENSLSISTEEASIENTTLPTPKPLIDEPSKSNNSVWYKKIIDDTRNEFLNNVPNLN